MVQTFTSRFRVNWGDNSETGILMRQSLSDLQILVFRKIRDFGTPTNGTMKSYHGKDRKSPNECIQAVMYNFRTSGTYLETSRSLEV